MNTDAKISSYVGGERPPGERHAHRAGRDLRYESRVIHRAVYRACDRYMGRESVLEVDINTD